MPKQVKSLNRKVFLEITLAHIFWTDSDFWSQIMFPPDTIFVQTLGI